MQAPRVGPQRPCAKATLPGRKDRAGGPLEAGWTANGPHHCVRDRGEAPPGPPRGHGSSRVSREGNAMLPALLGSRSPEHVGPREGEGTRTAPTRC